MGRRKAKAKVVSKKRPVISTQFKCPFCEAAAPFRQKKAKSPTKFPDVSNTQATTRDRSRPSSTTNKRSARSSVACARRAYSFFFVVGEFESEREHRSGASYCRAEILLCVRAQVCGATYSCSITCACSACCVMSLGSRQFETGLDFVVFL